MSDRTFTVHPSSDEDSSFEDIDHLPLRDVNARLMSEISRLEGEKNAGEVENAKKVSAVDQLVQFNDLLMKENEIKTGFVNVEGSASKT
ncbi:hypothetical protein PRIPAC_93460 [Pristionchus pacificus]|uniref:Uncharacterized protein n=1 Tax=Pristionchus pacificus TaxID=54126 RepID=A0A2A6CD61_PRIPA|nr:hypothetical protein PRIPAC_93460 [Pristionchus pacificus]|eukprot:PDM76038.1 hypothetical protein PRIPAC_39642 [Pristionchus pacificus]